MEAVQLIAALGLLVGNFFFVAVEFSITRARPTMVAGLVAEEVRGARAFQHGVEHIDSYLSACQLGITICSIGLGVTAEPVLSEAFEGLFGEGELLGVTAAVAGFLLGYGTVAMLHVVLGELTPKSLAIARTRGVGLVLMPPMRIFYALTKPVVEAFNWLGNLVLKPFGVPAASEVEAEPHSESELKSLIAESERRGLLEPSEQQFAEGVFSFGDRRVREIMVPRTQIIAVSHGDSVTEAARQCAESGHRRLPLCGPDGGLDEPAGVLNLTDLAGALATGDSEPPLEQLARPLFEAGELTLLDDLLELMRGEQQKIALIRDEYGTAVGLVTLENIIEQILGDIRDEYDPPGEPQSRRTERGLEVPGSANAIRLAEQLGIEIQSRAATVGGWVGEELGHPAEPGDELSTEGHVLEVLEVDGTQISKILIRPGGRRPAKRTRGGRTRASEPGPSVASPEYELSFIGYEARGFASGSRGGTCAARLSIRHHLLRTGLPRRVP